MRSELRHPNPCNSGSRERPTLPRPFLSQPSPSFYRQGKQEAMRMFGTVGKTTSFTSVCRTQFCFPCAHRHIVKAAHCFVVDALVVSVLDTDLTALFMFPPVESDRQRVQMVEGRKWAKLQCQRESVR